MKIFRFLPFALTATLILLSGCGKKQWQPYRDNELLLGTFVGITSYDSTLQNSVIKGAVDSAFGAIRMVEMHTNPFNPRSEIARINARTDSQLTFPVSDILYPLLRQALQISEMTNGAYDPTLWPVFRLWHFGTDSAAVPPQDSLAKYLKKVNYRDVSLSPGKIRFAQPGMGIDLSGISKGYAVEQARRALLKFGLRNFIIDAGGNLGIEWEKKKPVNVYIRHPRKEGTFYGSFAVKATCGVSTSGDYQNYFVQDSTTYHHILDPATGFPARGAVSVTVVAKNATTADGLSTALFVEGAQKAFAFIQSRPGLEGVVIYQSADTLASEISSGLKPVFKKFK